MIKKYEQETLCIHGGYKPSNGDPQVLPIAQSTTYRYDHPEFLAGLFDLKEEGHIYTRISNPTVAAFEEKINALEGGVGALAVSSGQAATTLAIFNICSAGDHIIASSAVYGGTYTLLSKTLDRLGIETTFVDPLDSKEEICSKIKENTKAIFGETIANPSLHVLDFEKFASIGKEHKIPFIVDNTFATPCLLKPFEHGANIVIHSATKYIDGHATSVGGVIIDGGNFDWANGKFPDFTEPQAAYHGLQYIEAFGKAAYIAKARVQLLRDLGTTVSPFNAFLFHNSLETLHLRMERHCSNTLALAKYLEAHENVSWVKYPLLESDENYHLAKKYLTKGASGVLSFGVKGGYEKAIEFIKKIEIISLVTHVGDLRTSLLHPASTTHRQLSEEEQISAGVTGDLIRLSVGVENIDDLIKDIDQALREGGK